ETLCSAFAHLLHTRPLPIREVDEFYSREGPAEWAATIQVGYVTVNSHFLCQQGNRRRRSGMSRIINNLNDRKRKCDMEIRSSNSCFPTHRTTPSVPSKK